MEQIDLLDLGLGFVFLGDRNVVERHAVKIGVMLGVQVIADDQGKLTGKFPVTLSIQQIHEAVIVLRNKNRDAWSVIAQADDPIHAKLVRNGAKGAVKVFQVQSESLEVPFDAREVVALFTGLMLLEMQDIAVVSVDKLE